MIQVQELTKRYGSRAAIDGISFSVEKGQVMGFLGPNGAGKTTTMRILAGVMGATYGTASVAGYAIHENPQAAKKRTGYLPEIPPVYRDMTVSAYLHFAAKLHGIGKGERPAMVESALSKMALNDVAGRLIGHLSKGFQQRVGIAQALVHDPDVLILDEPTVGLDPSQIREVRDLIRSLAGQHTVLLSTHILPEVEMTCEKVVLIDGGKIRYEGTIEELRLQQSSQNGVDLEVAHPDNTQIPALNAITGVVKAVALPGAPGHYRIQVDGEADPRQAIAKLAVESGWGLLGLSQRRDSLEDIFVQLTTEEKS